MANLITVRNWTPKIDPTAWFAPNATIIGNVEIGPGANIWFGAVLRGDQNLIRIGERASIQDNSVLHCNEENPTIIGANVTLGHCAVLEGCTIGDYALIGMNATVLDGATVGCGALIAAGGVVKERDSIPDWTMAAGIPAKARKRLEGMALEHVKTAAAHYQKLMALYEHLGRPVATGEDGEG